MTSKAPLVSSKIPQLSPKGEGRSLCTSKIGYPQQTEWKRHSKPLWCLLATAAFASKSLMQPWRHFHTEWHRKESLSTARGVMSYSHCMDFFLTARYSRPVGIPTFLLWDCTQKTNGIWMRDVKCVHTCEKFVRNFSHCEKNTRKCEQGLRRWHKLPSCQCRKGNGTVWTTHDQLWFPECVPLHRPGTCYGLPSPEYNI